MSPDTPRERPDPYQPKVIPGSEHSPMPKDPREQNLPRNPPGLSRQFLDRRG
jgi:hypothetical protein